LSWPFCCPSLTSISWWDDEAHHRQRKWVGHWGDALLVMGLIRRHSGLADRELDPAIT